MPYQDANYQFLQLYFVGNANSEIDQRCALFSHLRRAIIGELRELLHRENQLVQLFQIALERMPSDDHLIVIRPDKKPVGEHAGRFNVPTMEEVAIIIVGDQFNNRDIVLHRRNSQVERVSVLHRCYDALQYPLLFCRGEDGYHLEINMIDPTNGNLINYFLFEFIQLFFFS